MSSVSGVTGNPSFGCYLRRPGSLSRSRLLLPPTIPCAARNNHNGFLLRPCRSRICLPGGYLRKCNDRTKTTHFINCAMEASYSGGGGGGGEGDWSSELGEPVVFPRINVRDPYKRLGISREASEDEIQGARNFLVRKYARHKPSVDAIESAHDKIIMQKFYERKNPKIDIGKKVREVKQSKFLQAVSNRFQTPSTMVIVKASIAFLVLGVLTVLFPTEDGPTLQVAISLMATFYFIHDRLKSKIRAILYGIGAFMFSWLFGTFLMVSVIPPLPFIKGMRSFEATTSLITYVLLWVSSTYLK